MERNEEDGLSKWKWTPESYEEISEYIRQVDEILDFIKPFPRDHCPEPGIPLQRSTSSDATNHLENLIKLVEQLKGLKEKDSKINERTQYLKDLKKLRERKKLLKYEAELGTSSPAYWTELNKEEKNKSSMSFRKTSRGRSKSVSVDELIKDGRFRRGRFPSDEEQRRKMSTGSQKTEKSKISKWTKVKEAFRWERASVEGKVCPRREDVHYLQVPQDKTPESLSDSPLSGQISGSSSVGAPSTICLAVSSGYSGEHSSEGHSTSSGYGIELPPPPPPLPSEDDFLSLPLIQDLSSSSSSEKLDELLTYSELLAKGNDRNDLIVDSFDSAFHNVHQADDLESRRSKSLDGDTVLGPNSSLMQHLSKESLNYSKKTHKTAWGKVKDIIQTRKDSLKKKPKKRNCEKGIETFSSQSGFDFECQEGPSSPEEKSKELISKQRIEVTESAEDVSNPPSPNKPISDSVAKRRLTPVLTITLPSTEELRSISPANAENNQKEEKGKTVGENVDYFEDIPKYEKNKTGTYHRFSKWTKVKRAFLTNPSRTLDFLPEASSAPSSPNKQMSFFSDIESDELSSGDWTDYKIQNQEKITEEESSGVICQEDIQKHYQELNRKLTHEFDQKMREWERMKSSKHDGGIQKQKSEDWDKKPRSITRQRESMTIPLPKLDDLSPEFKKKLDEWKKIKKSQTISTVPGTLPKDESQNQNFKMRIGEWQRWRPRGNPKLGKTDQNEEFAKKLEEWQRIKGTIRRSRSQSGGEKKEDGRNRSPSPDLRRKNSKKKTTNSGKSSGTESLSGSLKEKDGRGNRKQQKEKDLQWLEKELHKIERGKMRLEREKEKFLEREARLEKMKRTMGTTSPTQEILIKTPTGFFRFEGISQKFTKKLYEWEKARGIAPEASTFALLEECVNQSEERSNGMSLQRSKSMGSVMEVSSTVQDLPHHPSSLSLNDVDELDVTGIDESRASSEPGIVQEDEPEAIIVDVEDVVEETAALMTDVLVVKGEIPVYSYAPVEITQLIDSSASESDTEVKVVGEDSTMEVMNATCRLTGDESEDEDGGNGDEEEDEEEEEEEEEEDSADGKHLQEKNLEFPELLNQQEAVTRVQELSSQLLCLAEKLELALNDRMDDRRGDRKSLYHRRKMNNYLNMIDNGIIPDENDSEDSKVSMKELSQLPSLITNKVLELKCGLNSLTESPGSDTPIFKFSTINATNQLKDNPEESSLSLSKNNHNEEESFRSIEKSKIQILYGEGAADEYDRHRESKTSPEMIKHKIKEKISLMQKMTTEGKSRNFKSFCGDIELETKENGNENVVVVRKNCKGNKQKKLLKTRRITDTTIAYKQIFEESRTSSEKEDDNVVEVRFPVHINTEDKTPANVFVPTTRKIISPVKRDNKGTTSVLSYVIDDIISKDGKNKEESNEPAKGQSKTSESTAEKIIKRDIGIPPLPNSPISPRKPTSPNIRMMIAKYNQKIEQTTGSDTPSWRSPIFDRKFQNLKMEKSASVGLIKNNEKSNESQESLKGILKSSSASIMNDSIDKNETELTASALRALRIKKAKEEFLSRGPGGDSWSSVASTPTTESTSKRLSHISIGSESSCEGFDINLIKSASAGTIHLENESRRSSDLEHIEDSTKPMRTTSKFGISSIKSKFRKVRMKRGKERDGAVSTLCRQSLLLEVPIAPTIACTSKSCPSSPVLDRSKSKMDNWIKNPFKMRESK